MKKWFTKSLATFIIYGCVIGVAHAQEFTKDLSLSSGDIDVANNIIVGTTVRVYATIHNNSNQDLKGTVKFYDERVTNFIGTDQPISIIANKTDAVFIDWRPLDIGEHPIAVRVIPWDTDGDNPDNNKAIQIIHVDRDTDLDGIADRIDPDDDDDGVPDNEDAFPRNAGEHTDTDKDGVGNNEDDDDDDDGVIDIEDSFPDDFNEKTDRDNDGVGDNTDLFPDDPGEAYDSDHDGVGNNADPDDENHGPVLSINVSKNKVRTGQILTVNAIRSHDPDGNIATVEWDFGDNTQSSEFVVDHRYQKAGSYELTVRVTDNKGEWREKIVPITVISSLWLTFGITFLIGGLIWFFFWLKKREKKPLPKKKK